jgi:hypothetical protein
METKKFCELILKKKRHVQTWKEEKEEEEEKEEKMKWMSNWLEAVKWTRQRACVRLRGCEK